MAVAEFGEAIDRFKQEALQTQLTKEEAARSKVTANVNIEIPAASRQSNSTTPSPRDISTASIEVNNTLKLSASEQAHREEALAEVSWPIAVASTKGEVTGVLRCTACLILMEMGVFLKKR